MTSIWCRITNRECTPNSTAIKYALKRISFASHIDISESANYSVDKSKFFVNLKSIKLFNDNKIYTNTYELCDELSDIKECDTNLSFEDRSVLYYISGWIQLKLSHKFKKCNICSCYLLQHSQIIPEEALLTTLKSNKFHPLPQIFAIIEICESI